MNTNPISSPSQIMNDANVPLAKRDALVAVAAARRVAYSLPLPIESVNNEAVAKAVGNPSVYYRTNYQVGVRRTLGQLNELAVCDLDLAELACRLFWEARYRIAFDPESPEAMSAVTGLVSRYLADGASPLNEEAMEALHAFDAGHPFASVLPAMESFWQSGMGEG